MSTFKEQIKQPAGIVALWADLRRSGRRESEANMEMLIREESCASSSEEPLERPVGE